MSRPPVDPSAVLRDGFRHVMYALAGRSSNILLHLPGVKNEFHNVTKDGENFKYVASEEFSFLLQLEFILSLLEKKGNEQPSFLEIGCGSGAKMVLYLVYLYHRGLTSPKDPGIAGIDINKKYLAGARKILPDTAELHCCDATEFDRYQEFDIIYFYTPFSNGLKERKLEEKILATAKPGAVIWAYDHMNVKPPETDFETPENAPKYCNVVIKK